MREGSRFGMKYWAHADFSLLSVPSIADHRVSDGGEMYANLIQIIRNFDLSFSFPQQAIKKRGSHY